MNKIISSKIISLIILSTLLVLGTIATILPSAQAAPYYEDRYDPEYPAYGDSYDYKSKDSNSNVILNKIKCNNINDNLNNADVSLGVPNSGEAIAEDEGQALTTSELGNDERNGYKQNDDDFRFVCINNNDNEDNIVVGNGTTPEPVIQNPKITVIKEMFICSEPTIQQGEIFINAFCGENPSTIPDPDSPVWIPWENCNIAGFCENFSEENFTMQIEQNPGVNFIRYEFPGTNEGRTVNVESGTYQISEEGSPGGTCLNPSYDGTIAISNFPPPPPGSFAFFCFILEGDCSDTIEAGEEKTCTIKNYLRIGSFGVPTGGLAASNINTDTSSFDINTSGDLASSFFSPPTIAQETEEDSSALEKIAKLKQQWIELTS